VEHKKERNITQERLDKIKEDVNAIFEQLKGFRKTESAEFEKSSNAVRDNITERLNQVKGRADEKANFKTLHDDIKALQHEIRNQHFLKSDETALRKAFDDAFHYISEQRNRYFSDKFESRISGLKDVMSRMEKGLEHDRKDMDYFTKKADNPRIQSLELQLLKVRIRQIKETIISKEDKLKDIEKTLESILKQSGKATKPEKPIGEIAEKGNKPKGKKEAAASEKVTEQPEAENKAADVTHEDATEANEVSQVENGASENKETGPPVERNDDAKETSEATKE